MVSAYTGIPPLRLNVIAPTEVTMKRICLAITLAFLATVSINGFAADFSQSSKSKSSSKSNKPKSRQESTQTQYLKSLSYGDCVDYLKEEMKMSDSEANNRCGAVQ